MTFAHPAYLWLLICVPVAIAWYIRNQRRKADATLQIPTVAPFATLPRTYKEYLRHVNFALLMGALALCVIVLARPQSSDNWSSSSTEGIDIVVSLDVSYSMLTPDFKPNRVEAAKDVAAKFIAGRPNDNIGMVIFGKESYTLCPMTSDHAVLANMIQSVSTDLIDGSSTAIGDGLVTAINRIKDGQAKSKTIILLTDGTNNAGDVAPRDAAEVARTMGVRLYTIGVGSRGEVEMVVGTDPFGRPVKQKVKADIDEESLRNMAQITGGRYFRATDKASLAQIFDDIDSMEKTKMSVREFSRKEEKYFPFALAALVLLLLHVALRNTVLRHIP
jgi:Ca-activated chloride channel family protein